MVDQTEEEQVEQLKRWWEENGTSLVIGIVVVLASVFGYRSWESSVRQTAESASALYEEMVQAVEVSPFEELSDENRSTAEFVASQLKNEYGSSSYAHFAAMHLARLAVESDDLEKAETELRWVLENGVEDELGIVVNLRLARLQFARKMYDEALAQLDAIDAGGHLGSYEELRGDILYALDRNDEAREAYQRAIANVEDEANRPFLKMKLEDLVAPKAEISADEPENTADSGVVEEESVAAEEVSREG